MSTSKFSKGERVVYIPRHANGDPRHPDSELGIVWRVSDNLVFVKFDNSPYTAKGCNPSDLEHVALENGV